MKANLTVLGMLLVLLFPCVTFASESEIEKRMAENEQRFEAFLNKFGNYEEIYGSKKITEKAASKVDKQKEQKTDTYQEPGDEIGNFLITLQNHVLNVAEVGASTLAESAKQNEINSKKESDKVKVNGATKVKADQAHNSIIRADILNKQGKSNEAIELYMAAIKADASRHDAVYKLACAYAKNRKADVAIATLRHAIALNPDYKSLATSDPDFHELQSNSDFQQLTK